MPLIKDFKKIVSDLKNFLYSTRPNVDTSPGNYTRDVVIDAPANEMATLYTELNRASNAQSSDTASAEDVESLGRNFQIFRKGPTPASGIVTFYSFTEPASTITVPRGTQLATKSSVTTTSRQFVTTQDGYLSSANFRASTGRYEIDVPARATIGGTSSNIAAGALSAIMTPINGVSGVYNAAPITNGTDFEPLSTYRNRIKTAIVGNNVGTASGYYQTIIRINEVQDAKVAAIGTGPEELRRPDPGAVDIYIRGIVSTQAPTIIFTVTQAPPFNIYFEKQPFDITAADSIIVVGSVTTTMSRGTHFDIVQDKSNFGGTVRASDHIKVTSAQIGETLGINYSFNSLVESAQVYMNSDSRKVLGADLLINAAFPRKIDVSCTVRILPGFTSSTVISNVTQNLQTALSAYQIGEEVQQSDLIAVITGTAGVDDVTVPLEYFAENSDTGALVKNSAGNIIIPINSYAIAGDIVVTVRS